MRPDIEILGGSMTQTPGRIPRRTPSTLRTSHAIVEAALKVDSSGSVAMHPYINDSLNRLLARWTFKHSTLDEKTRRGH